ncbi:MAG: S8 family peptidase [Sphingobacteriaceae bacterium]|nr:S8 family peptidase [Sphingobacteriaceae bacterium]
MIRLLLVLLFLSLVLFNPAQKEFNNSLKARIANRSLNGDFPVVVKGNVVKIKTQSRELGFQFHYSVEDIASITINLDNLSKLIEQKIVSYAEFIEPNKKVMSDTANVRNRVGGIKTGQAPLPQAYDGTGVIFGIIDTGTDWRHDDFRNTPGGTTRIKWIWDQKVVGSAPQPYNYGTEWTEAQINFSICTHDDLAGNSHGTHVSGVAVGNGSATGNFQGCAPKANIVVVSLDFNKPGPTIADGVNYIFSKATLLGKPCVINASVGDYYGSHDGTDMEAKLIEGMVKDKPGRVMVAAGGNAGEARYHTLTQPPVGDTTFTWFTNNTANLTYRTYGDTNQVKNLFFNIGVNRPSDYTNLGSTGFKPYNYGIPLSQTDTVKHNGNRIGIVQSWATINTYGVYELLISIQADSTGYLWRTETRGSGLHHAWNFEFKGWNLPTVGQYPRMSKYVMPDTLFSIVSGFQCLDDITTVANYCNVTKYYDYNNVLQNAIDSPGGSKVGNSSIGPTRNMKLKPDIAATGSGVFAAAAVNIQAPWILANPSAMAPGGQHVYGSGTSASSPVVAGFAALFLQSNPNLTSKQVRNAIVNCAYNDGHTGVVPNFAWGYGKLDAKASMMCIITGKQEIELINKGKIFPNPFSDQVQLKFSKEIYGDAFVYSIDGKLLMTTKVSGDELNLNNSGPLQNYKGLLIVRVLSEGTTSVFKVVKE